MQYNMPEKSQQDNRQAMKTKKNKRFICTIFVLFLASTAAVRCAAMEKEPAAAMAESGKAYIIQPMDKLTIKVWPYDELSMEVQVRPDGRISYPMLGEIRVSGMSAGRVGEIVAKSLEEYMKSPRVAVNVENFRLERVFVLGAVKNPGMFDIRNGDTIFDVISRAGGFAENARKSKVGLIKAPGGNVRYPYDFRLSGKGGASGGISVSPTVTGDLVIINFAELLGKAEFPENCVLRDGDIIFVPKGRKIDWNNIYAGVTSLYRLFRLDDIIDD